MNENISDITITDLRSYSNSELGYCIGVGKREDQQDRAYCYADDELIYAVVCDGIGGAAGGAAASDGAVHLSERFFREQVDSGELTIEWLRDSLVEVDRQIHDQLNGDGSHFGGGTTEVCVLIVGNQLYWSSVGDSRAYLIHNHEAVQLTTDLTYGLMLDRQLAAGEITEEQYQHELPQRDALICYIGMGDLKIINRNLKPLELQAGDYILVCSDGIFRSVPEDSLCEILAQCRTAQEAATEIEARINRLNYPDQDNYACIIIRPAL